MTAFPTELEVTVNNGYSFQSPQSIWFDDYFGGQDLTIKDYRYGNTPFSLVIVTDRNGHGLFSSFFDEINQGADKFTIFLDSYDGTPAEHTGQMQIGSLIVDGSSDPRWIISFTFISERLPRVG